MQGTRVLRQRPPSGVLGRALRAREEAWTRTSWHHTRQVTIKYSEMDTSIILHHPLVLPVVMNDSDENDWR